MIKTGTCKHFNGIQHNECESKINIREITGGDDLGWARRIPCFKANKSDTICESYSEPTEEEIKADEAKFEKAFENIMVVMPLVGELKEKHKNGGFGIVECPVCKDNLHYGIAACNGHCHMKCDTPDCISFME